MNNILKLQNPNNLLLAINEYNKSKYNSQNGYICWFFGFYRLYTSNPLLWIIYIISCVFFVGIIWWIFDLFQVSNYVENMNKELDTNIYLKYLPNE